MKKIKLVANSTNGIALLVEKDAGNEIRILTGNKANSKKFWTELNRISVQAMTDLELGINPEGKDYSKP